MPHIPVQPTLEEIKDFELCPFTQDGKICGEVSWKGTGNKWTQRHMKQKHFIALTDMKVWRCPNPRCHNAMTPFSGTGKHVVRATHAKKDRSHIALCSIGGGDGRQMMHWVKAGKPLRAFIRKKLRGGVPWSLDLLEPISVSSD